MNSNQEKNYPKIPISSARKRLKINLNFGFLYNNKIKSERHEKQSENKKF